ncbi:MAG TPA: hypothetical protein VL095_01075 [Flavisolibacter sp.]|nr:hypothetical protein [Flavisolibacter sp.]
MNKKFTMTILKAICIASVALLASCHSSRRIVGIEEGWEIIGEHRVNFVRDKDKIVVNNRTLYTAVRFKVERRDIRISELKIYFQNGDKLEPNIEEDIQADQLSRVIELGREGRYIDYIEFKYRTLGSLLKGRANVLILGRKYYRGY